jgi:hypothetical protein
MNKEILIESLKELGRVMVLAIIPIMIDALTSDKFDTRVLLVTAAIAGLRFVDKLLHLHEPEGTSGGLTRF